MKDINLNVLARTAALSGLLTVAGAGAAFADSGTISTTGPNSTNVITSSETNTVVVSNTNNVSVSNSNSQSGTSGAASVTGNTLGGSATSGGVTNTNTGFTTVSINNAAVGGLGGGSGTGSGGGNGSGSGAGSGGVGGGTGAVTPLGVGGSGSGLGSGSAEVLPSVGCSVVCDVAGLRGLYEPAKASSAASALDQAKGISAALLALAAALSLVGAGGSAAFAARRAKSQG